MAPCGTVKWFDEAQEYGFIVPDEPGPDVFVHRAYVVPGCTLAEGQKVRYRVKDSPKGPIALDVEHAGA